VDRDRFVDPMADLVAELEVLSVEPGADTLSLKIRMQTSREVLILRTVTDEA
jgi:hypothetical protein